MSLFEIVALASVVAVLGAIVAVTLSACAYLFFFFFVKVPKEDFFDVWGDD